MMTHTARSLLRRFCSSLGAARHGGAQVWIPGAYDPDTHLYIFPTGNPTPAYTSATRGDKANLYTCSIIAVDVAGNFKVKSSQSLQLLGRAQHTHAF